jgi:hypothetical protein
MTLKTGLQADQNTATITITIAPNRAESGTATAG